MMGHVLIVGGGLAGCTAALELANRNIRVTLLEKSDSIGGKVRHYGCMATDSCNNCGLCLTGDLWSSVEKHGNITVITHSELRDVIGGNGKFRAVAGGNDGLQVIPGISSIIISIGFNEFSSLSHGNLEISNGDGVITGYKLEKLMSKRSKAGILPENPERIAFIQCFGSRDVQEKAQYCSRVCCGYSSRSARVLKQFHPDSEITFFYMDLQKVEEGEYFNTLKSEGMEFIRCRPVKIKPGIPARVIYEQPGSDEIIEREFDLVVLSEGIHPARDAGKIAEVCTLGIDKNGFLKYVSNGKATGIYIAGCASGPKKIEEVYSEALTVAREIANR